MQNKGVLGRRYPSRQHLSRPVAIAVAMATSKRLFALAEGQGVYSGWVCAEGGEAADACGGARVGRVSLHQVWRGARGPHGLQRALLTLPPRRQPCLPRPPGVASSHHLINFFITA